MLQQYQWAIHNDKVNYCLEYWIEIATPTVTWILICSVQNTPKNGDSSQKELSPFLGEMIKKPELTDCLIMPTTTAIAPGESELHQ